MKRKTLIRIALFAFVFSVTLIGLRLLGEGGGVPAKCPHPTSYYRACGMCGSLGGPEHIKVLCFEDHGYLPCAGMCECEPGYNHIFDTKNVVE